ncbi:hypothetical protein HDV00_008600, partial [Rhizophlyctis rosea]
KASEAISSVLQGKFTSLVLDQAITDVPTDSFQPPEPQPKRLKRATTWLDGKETAAARARREKLDYLRAYLEKTDADGVCMVFKRHKLRKINITRDELTSILTDLATSMDFCEAKMHHDAEEAKADMENLKRIVAFLRQESLLSLSFSWGPEKWEMWVASMPALKEVYDRFMYL